MVKDEHLWVVTQFDLDIGEEDLPDSYQPRMREMTFNLATGEATSRQLADVICDFPRVPDELTGAHFLHACCHVVSHIAHLASRHFPWTSIIIRRVALHAALQLVQAFTLQCPILGAHHMMQLSAIWR